MDEIINDRKNWNSNPLVSVIMPVYNCETFIDEAISSIVNQTYENLEIIVIDDNSYDGTIEKLRLWQNQDSRIQLFINETNLGISKNLNLGIVNSRGKYIARMDGDDICFLNRIFEQVAYMEQNPGVDMVGAGYEFLNGTKKMVPQTDHERIKVGMLFCTQFAHPTVMFKSESVKKLKRLYNPAWTDTEDYEYWAYLKSEGFVFGNIAKPLLLYRTHEGNNSLKNSREHLFYVKTKQWKELKIDIDDDFISNLDYAVNFTPKEVSAAEILRFLRQLGIIENINQKMKRYEPKTFNRVMNNIRLGAIVHFGKKNILKNAIYSLGDFLMVAYFILTLKNEIGLQFCLPREVEIKKSTP